MDIYLHAEFRSNPDQTHLESEVNIVFRTCLDAFLGMHPPKGSIFKFSDTVFFVYF